MTQLLIALGAAVGGAFVGALVRHWLGAWYAHRRVMDRGRFKIYMMLMELNGLHFWIASRDLHREEPDSELAGKYWRLCLQIADAMREVDGLAETEDILRVMFSVKFETEWQRAKAFDSVLDRLGEETNPRYIRAIRQVTKENQLEMVRDVDEFSRRLRKIQGWP